MPSAEAIRTAMLLRHAMIRDRAPIPVTSTGIVRYASVDANGITQSYILEVDGEEGKSVPALGTSFGEGSTIPVFREGGAAIGDWLPGSHVLSFGSQSPVIVGGITVAQPSTFPRGFGFHVDSEGGWLIGGGLNDVDGVKVPVGSRSEMRKYGFVGYDDRPRLAYALINGDFDYTENGVTHQLRAGDSHLGFYDAGHLEVVSRNHRFAWMNGTEVLFSSERIDLGNNNFHALNWMRGMLWIGENYVGAGIRLGRGPDGANLFELLNESHVPLVTMRAGFPEDVNEVYARFGPPDPLPNMTIRTQDDDTILLDLHGGALRAGTVIADMLNVKGIHAGRAEFLKAGTVFNSWTDYGTATGWVIGYNDTGDVGQILGLKDGVIQAYLGSDGKIYSGDGTIWIEHSNMFFPSSLGGLAFYDHLDPNKGVILQAGVNLSSVATSIIYASGGPSRSNPGRGTLLLEAAGPSTVAVLGIRANDGAETINEIYLDADNLAFFGQNVAAKQTVTGAKGSNAALASLLTALAAYGLITDSSTA